MNIKEYTKCCVKFANDTMNWASLDENQHYVACAGESWHESCDNAERGISVKWAFHEVAFAIRECAPQAFVDSLLGEIQLAIDDEWPLEDLHNIIDDFS